MKKKQKKQEVKDTDIPLTKAWKERQQAEQEAQAQEPEQAESPKEDYRQERRERDFSNEEQQEDFMVNRAPSSRDTTQIWDKKVFASPQGTAIEKTLLSSMAMSNYPTKIDIVPELSVAQNRLIYGQGSILLKLSERYGRNKDRYWLDKNVDPNEDPFLEHMKLILTKLDAGNKSYLSIDMLGLKEMNAVRKHIERNENEKKPLDQKLGVR